MDLLVIVNDSPLSSHSSLTALRFCKAATGKGHSIKQVFFYLDGVYQLLDISASEAGEPGLLHEWQQYAAASDTDLAVCAAASHRRIPASYPPPKPFRDGSLIEMMDLATRVDRMLSFGGC